MHRQTEARKTPPQKQIMNRFVTRLHKIWRVHILQHGKSALRLGFTKSDLNTAQRCRWHDWPVVVSFVSSHQDVLTSFQHLLGTLTFDEVSVKPLDIFDDRPHCSNICKCSSCICDNKIRLFKPKHDVIFAEVSVIPLDVFTETSEGFPAAKVGVYVKTSGHLPPKQVF